VSLTLPSVAKNATTDTWLIYRTTDGGTSPQSLGLIGSVPVTNTVYIDDFVKWPKDEQALPLYSLYETQDGTGGVIRVPQDSAPPSFRHMANFRGRLVGISRDSPRALRGSVAGIPESWPETSVILSFPWAENDRLVASVQVGEVLLIAAEGLMMTLSDWPETVSGVWNAARVEPLRGAPGCVGQYALEPFSVAGESRAAWVSPFGIHVTNGVESFRISDDLDWDNEVAQENLGSSVLFFDKSRQIMVFSFNSRAAADAASSDLPESASTETENDTEVWFHMAAEHRKQNGLPKMTRAPRSTTSMTQGLVAGVHRIYSGDTDGDTWLWEGGTGLAMTVRTRRMRSDIDMAHVPRAFLRHSDFGAGATATVLWESRREMSGESQIHSTTVSLASVKGTVFFVGRAGETHECEITTPAGRLGALLELPIDGVDIGKVAGAAA
jgi:hypothetical protein